MRIQTVNEASNRTQLSMKSWLAPCMLAVTTGLALDATAQTMNLDFEGFPESYSYHASMDSLYNQYPGIIFVGGAKILDGKWGSIEGGVQAHSGTAVACPLMYSGNQIWLYFPSPVAQLEFWYSASDPRGIKVDITDRGYLPPDQAWSRGSTVGFALPGIQQVMIYSGAFFCIDDLRFSYSPVPEPETYGLMTALGLVGFGIYRRRRK